jgi:hypothetical protein
MSSLPSSPKRPPCPRRGERRGVKPRQSPSARRFEVRVSLDTSEDPCAENLVAITLTRSSVNTSAVLEIGGVRL